MFKRTALGRTGLLIVGMVGSAALAHCSSDDSSGVTGGDAGLGDGSVSVDTGTGNTGDSGMDSAAIGDATALDGGVDAAIALSNGPDSGANPNVPLLGTAANGKAVFRTETFGNEGFWTDALKLPQGIVQAQLTPRQALGLGLSVNVDALDTATQQAVVAALSPDAGADAGPDSGTTNILDQFSTTVALLNANAVIGVVVKDSNADGKLDVTTGDKVGISCAVCHSVTDHSVFNLATGGSIGHVVDGPAVHTVNLGAIFATALNTRALYPMAQLKQADGTSTGRAPSSVGLTPTSTEAEFDAYFSNPAYYPVGMFDDTVDGNGNPMHNTPMFRADLAAPWGSAGELSKLDQFANTVYTALLDPTNLTTPGGRAFLVKAAGSAKLADDYTTVLTATGVTGYPYVKGTNTTEPAPNPDALVGVRLDQQKLLDLNAYLSSLPAPKGAAVDATVSARARDVFRGSGQCTSCHNVDQSVFVPPMIIPMKTIFPGDNPTVIATRDAPLSPIENTPGNTFDDKQIVINASLRGLVRGAAMPLLMDLARKPVFLHDNSVASLDSLLDPARGASAPHPFYLPDTAQRSDMVAYLKSLDDTSK